MGNPAHLALVAAALLVAGCPGPQPAPRARFGLPAVAFEPLTDAEATTFLRAATALDSWLTDHLPLDLAGPRLSEPVGVTIVAAVDVLGQTTGFDSALAAAGTDWPSFRTTLYRISACELAYSAREIERSVDGRIRRTPSPAVASALRRRRSQAKQIGAAVPTPSRAVYERRRDSLIPFVVPTF